MQKVPFCILYFAVVKWIGRIDLFVVNNNEKDEQKHQSNPCFLDFSL